MSAAGYESPKATAMLARLEGRARYTLDVDLYRRDGSLADAERALREAAAVDLGYYFRFRLGTAKHRSRHRSRRFGIRARDRDDLA